MIDVWEHKKYLWIFLLVGFIVYLPIFNNGFVWDDIPLILKNPQVHQLNVPYLLGPNILTDASFYRPLHVIYVAFAYSLFGQDAIFYHVLQLILHLACKYLLFILLYLFFNKGTSLILALIFLALLSMLNLLPGLRHQIINCISFLALPHLFSRRKNN